MYRVTTGVPTDRTTTNAAARSTKALDAGDALRGIQTKVNQMLASFVDVSISYMVEEGTFLSSHKKIETVFVDAAKLHEQMKMDIQLLEDEHICCTVTYERRQSMSKHTGWMLIAGLVVGVGCVAAVMFSMLARWAAI